MMQPFDFAGCNAPSILCIGAHSDDIEIGAGGTILSLSERFPLATIRWAVFSADGARRDEAHSSAIDFCAGYRAAEIEIHRFKDGLFPSIIADLKEMLEDLKRTSPDIIFTHLREDLHQDHRTLSDLTWQSFRDHLILEYEIPKYDGDMGRPNAFHPISWEVLDRKLDALDRHFGSQRSKQWFSRDTFRGLMRLRGMECRAESGFAEAFYCRKMIF